MPITALPTPPQPSDSPATFNSRAFDLLGALPAFVTEANALEAENAAAATAAANAVLASKTTGPASATDNTLPRFDGTTGKLLQGSGVVVDDGNNVTTSGIYYKAQPTVPTNTVQLWLQNAAGNLFFGRDSSTGSAFGEAYSSNIYSEGAYSLNFWTNSVKRMTLDASGNLTLSSGTLGYGAGAGGSATAVFVSGTLHSATINKPSGLVTIPALTGATTVVLTLYNSHISPFDGVNISLRSPVNGYYRYWVYGIASGATYICVETIGAARNEAVDILFQVIKGSTT